MVVPDGQTFQWGSLVGPAVIAALVAGIISIIGMLVNRATIIKTNEAKIEADRNLAQVRFEFEKELAERKIRLDLRASNRRKMQELAEELIAGFYEARDAMRAVRSPFGHSGEGATRPQEPNETTEEARRKNIQYVVVERFEKHRQPIAQLMSREYRSIAWFGEDIRKPFETLNGAIHNVFISARMLAENDFGDLSEEDRKLRLEWRNDIWGHGGENDKIAAKIDEAIVQITTICRPVLSAELEA